MRTRRSPHKGVRWITGMLAVIALSAVVAVPVAGGVEADEGPSEATVRATESDSELLYVTEGNRMRRFDIDSMDNGPLLEDVFVPAASAGGRDVNGTICPLPDGSGGFVVGEDTGQQAVRPGWGFFDADGKQYAKVAPTGFTSGPEPHGCAFAPDGTLFTTELGSQGFGNMNGQLIMWFPPYEGFPGEPDIPFPNGEYSEGQYCKLAIDLGTAGGVTVDHLGRVYAAQSSGLRIDRFSPPFPTAPNEEGGCSGIDSRGSAVALPDEVNREVFATGNVDTGMFTLTGLTIGPKGTLYATSVLTGAIGEYDLDGTLLRVVVPPGNWQAGLPVENGHPQAIVFDSKGTLYYADMNLRGTLPNVGPGPSGKIRRVTFDENGDPNPPEIIREGLSFPDGLAVFPGTLATEPPDEDTVTYTANFSDAQCLGFHAIVEALGLESVADVVRMGVDGWAGVHAGGGSEILTGAVPNDGPCEVEVSWPAEEEDRITDTAAGWGVTEEELHHLGGWIVIHLILTG